jgi:hypothetical protein
LLCVKIRGFAPDASKVRTIMGNADWVPYYGLLCLDAHTSACAVGLPQVLHLLGMAVAEF